MRAITSFSGTDGIDGLGGLIRSHRCKQKHLIHPAKSTIERSGLIQVAYDNLDPRIFETLCLGFIANQGANACSRSRQIWNDRATYVSGCTDD
jgi:hypothetical protein